MIHNLGTCVHSLYNEKMRLAIETQMQNKLLGVVSVWSGTEPKKFQD